MEFSIKVPEDYQLLKDLAQADVEFVVRKDQNYSGSWRKRGGVGAYMMLARKWDRLENFAENHDRPYDIFDLILTANDPEDILDDIKDLRCYLLLVESYLRQQMGTGVLTAQSVKVNIDPVVRTTKARKTAAAKGLAAAYGAQEDEHTGSDNLKGYGGHYGHD